MCLSLSVSNYTDELKSICCVFGARVMEVTAILAESSDILFYIDFS